MLCKFPEVLSKLRRQRGISQKRSAQELGISPALLSHYENGIRECGLDFLLRLSEYYSVSCDYLLGKSEIKNPNVYESEPEALALDRVLKTAAQYSEQVYRVLKDIAAVEIYRMARDLCEAAPSKGRVDFGLEDVDYRDLCQGAEGCLYSKIRPLAAGSDFSPPADGSVSEIIERAESIMKKHI